MPVCGLARNDRERDVVDAVSYSAKRCHCEPVTVSLVWQSVISASLCEGGVSAKR